MIELHSTSSPHRRGFTLAELLVVIGIILLVMALTLPAFTVIVSSRSVESARNVIASSLVRARGEAIRRGQPCGVYFYVDPDSGRSGAAIVTLDPLSDPDPYDQYKAFTRGVAGVPRDYQGGTFNPLTAQLNEPAMTSDRVVVLAADGDPMLPAGDPLNPYPAGYHDFNGRPLIVINQRSREPDALTTPGDTTTEPLRGRPTDPLGSSVDPTTFDSAEWGPTAIDELGTLELVSGIEPTLLPAGAGVQVMLGRTLEDTAADGAWNQGDTGFKYSIPGAGAPPPPDPDNPPFIERYARSGLILFDAEGHLIQADYRVDADSKLGRVMGLDLVLDPDVPNAFVDELLVVDESAVLGLVIYQKDAFQSASSDGTAIDWKGGIIATLGDPTAPFTMYFRTTEGDVTFIYPPDGRPTAAMTDPVPAGTDWRFHEYAEERWLDANTIPLMVNRYSGTLVEAE